MPYPVVDPAGSVLAEWRNNPALMANALWHIDLDRWQARALEAYAAAPRTRVCLRACAGPGKSFLLAIAGIHHLLCHGDEYEHPVGVAVSCTGANLRDTLWRTLAELHGRSPILSRLFRHTAEAYVHYDYPSVWRISARSYAHGASPAEQGRTLSGLHGRWVMVLIDEAGDMSPAVGRSAEQAIGNCDVGRVMVAGNPTSQTGLLYEASTRLSNLYRVIRITGDPDDPERSPRIPLDWASEQIALYGRDNPWVQAYILGEFPQGGLNQLMSVDEVETSMARNPPPETYNHSQKRLGVDVARYGDDRTVIFGRQGLMAHIPGEMRGASTMEVAARVAKAMSEWDSEAEFIDGTGGYGAGVIDVLRQGGSHVVEVNFSGSPEDPQYRNKRAEMWFRMANWVKAGGALPRVEGLARELTAPTYSFVGGKFALEEKEQIKKRMGFSPDIADALALTFAWEERPGGDSPVLRRRRSVKVDNDFDPLERR